MLNFIGSGSAFNIELGNNSCFYKKDRQLFLIDCGSSTFQRILELNLLEDVDHIHVYISHTHPDHVGSLGDLIFYAYYITFGQQAKLTVYHDYTVNVVPILRGMGVAYYFYKSVAIEDETVSIEDMSISFKPVKSNHVPHIPCYGLEMMIGNTSIYYSADSREIPDEILRNLTEGKYDYFYQDTCYADFEDNPHLHIAKLFREIPTEYRKIVYCMHLDKGFHKDTAYALGFDVVENYK